MYLKNTTCNLQSNEPARVKKILITYTKSEGSGEPAHSRSLTRTFAVRSYNIGKPQTKGHISDPYWVAVHARLNDLGLHDVWVPFLTRLLKNTSSDTHRPAVTYYQYS